MAQIETSQKQKLLKPSKISSAGKRLRRHPTTFIGIAIVLFFLILAFIGPYIAPYHYSAQNLSEKLQPPSDQHFFGTDQFGRDIYSRILVGSRDVFIVAGSGTALAVFLGLLLGLFSGYRGGIIDEISMRCMDVILSIPALLLAMVILFSLGPSRFNVVLVVGFLYIPMVARVVRSVVLDLKTRQFIEAAKLRGESSAYILFKEILPNVLPHLAVEASMRFSYAIFLVASLGFLGLGVQPPRPDWGLMVGEARSWFHQARWVLYFPAGAIALLVVGVGFMSDGLRNMLLPGGVSDD
ncbi:MAG: ABC transporter permease [Bacillota bacterium]|jgi:peptide/nickel transport system permease protein